MSDLSLRLVDPHPTSPADQPRLPLGRYLVENGVITQDRLVQALQIQARLAAPLGEILVSHGWANKADIQTALAQQYRIQRADLTMQPPDSRFCDLMPREFWLRHQVIPWLQLGSVVMVATAHPDKFRDMCAGLDQEFPDCIPILASEDQIDAAIARRYADTMAQAASTRTDARFSCRTWTDWHRLLAAGLALGVLAGVAMAPTWGLSVFGALAVLTLLLFSMLKFMGFVAHLLSHSHLTAPKAAGTRLDETAQLPKVSVMVPLFKEREIASALIKRLNRLTYPKTLLDVVLVLEEHDEVTRQTLAETTLPNWMRVIVVPAHGGLTTKPRAMNYALDFCRGDIIGVWDAEDAPAPDQIEQVVSKFAGAAPDVVCLQGILDYYNPRTNWRARCFTIEYSSWFRVVLPGIARLGLVVPLGGTTLFIRRKTLEDLGGWDAHNVTEDADLGVRLCRAGLRTELIDTVTYEEANCRAWPWVRQRSRWLKGFMVTYLVHMRDPAALWSDLGAWRFFGFQAFFLGTLGQFLLAPLLWSFWLILLGVSHPAEQLVPSGVINAASAVFILTEILAICIGVVAVSSARRRFLIGWVPTMMLYYPLGVLAAYKAAFELVFRPFFWDKTQHGHAGVEHTPHDFPA